MSRNKAMSINVRKEIVIPRSFKPISSNPAIITYLRINPKIIANIIPIMTIPPFILNCKLFYSHTTSTYQFLCLELP